MVFRASRRVLAIGADARRAPALWERLLSEEFQCTAYALYGLPECMYFWAVEFDAFSARRSATALIYIFHEIIVLAYLCHRYYILVLFSFDLRSFPILDVSISQTDSRVGEWALGCEGDWRYYHCTINYAPLYLAYIVRQAVWLKAAWAHFEALMFHNAM